MGKDLPTKNLLNCPDVFSDIANVNLFDGEELLGPDELEQMPTELIYKDNYGVMSHHYLDTRMKVTEHQADIAIFCIENQSGVSNIMPVRDMGYLYSNYNEQIKRIRSENEGKGIHHITEGIGKEQKLIPVVSLVLYYGQEPWNGPEKLSDMMSVPESWEKKLGPLIEDHSVRIVHLASQDKKTRGMYRSDFRHIVDFLACVGDRRKYQEYIQDKDREICHPEEYLDMLAVFSNDTRFTKIKENVLKRRKEGKERVTMYFSINDELENIGRQKGMAEGKKEGKKEVICNMLSDNQSPELISKYTKEPLEYIYQVQQEMVQFAREETVYETASDK